MRERVTCLYGEAGGAAGEWDGSRGAAERRVAAERRRQLASRPENQATIQRKICKEKEGGTHSVRAVGVGGVCAWRVRSQNEGQ